MKEKNKIVVHRIVWFWIFVFSLGLMIGLIFAFEGSDSIAAYIIIQMILLPFVIVAFVIFIMSFFLSYKEYQYNKKTISVYAGYFHHTLRIDGEKYDEHNTLSSFIPIVLSTTLDDGTKLEAKISLTNRITLKINDKLYEKKEG